jgi:hypothetical protein
VNNKTVEQEIEICLQCPLSFKNGSQCIGLNKASPEKVGTFQSLLAGSDNTEMIDWDSDVTIITMRNVNKGMGKCRPGKQKRQQKDGQTSVINTASAV